VCVLNVITFSFTSGTSNWSGDYFVNTGGTKLVKSCIIQLTFQQLNIDLGVGLVVNSNNSLDSSNLQSQLKEVFDRDWNSDYAHPLI